MAKAKAKKAGTAKKATPAKKTATTKLKKKATVNVKVKRPAASKTTKKASSTAKISTPKVGPISVGKTAYNRAQLIKTLCEQSGADRKQVIALLDSLGEIMIAHLVKKGPGKFKLPGILTMKIKDKPATKQRTGINPFTGESMVFSAKPARRSIKIAALKKFKDAV